MFLQTTRINSKKVPIDFLVLSEWYCLKNLSIPFPHWNLDGPKKSGSFVGWAYFNFGTRVSPYQLALFAPSKSQSKAFYLCWSISMKMNGEWFFSVQWNPDWPEMPTNAISFDMPGYWNFYFFSPTCFVFHQNVNRFPCTWGGFLVSKYLDEYSRRPNWSAGWPKVAKKLFK